MANTLCKGEKKLGFGLMRIPQKALPETCTTEYATTPGNEVDIPQLCEMVDRFMEKGFTYFDTAYVYLNGSSEKAFKTAVVDRYPREAYTIADKLPASEKDLKDESDIDRIFNTSLKRTGAGYFDFYLLHNINQKHYAAFNRFHCWERLLEKKAQGLIRHLGFSFHDTPELLDQVLTEHPEVEFVQLQINYLDWEDPRIQSRRCYEVARKHGKPIIIMEPVKGGLLVNLNEEMESYYRAQNPSLSNAGWAIRYAASLDGVIMVLSGMSTIDQLNDNVGIMENFVPISQEETGCIDKVVDLFKKIPMYQCTGCDYCSPGCPAGIPIPSFIKYLNQSRMFGLLPSFKNSYAEKNVSAASCISCGQCEGICPQHLPIIQIMGETSSVFD